MSAPLASTDSAAAFDTERHAGRRFGFGRNWARFLATVDEARIRAAEASLTELLGAPLRGRTFLDIGSGSGLFSLAALRLGARRVRSFDFDPESVRCAEELRTRFTDGVADWTIERGSVLDAEYLARLGTWDVVYSWGVLHHTGQLWAACERAAACVAPDGLLAIAIYNDQGPASRAWHRVKRIYNTGWLGRTAVSAVFIPYFVVGGAINDALHRRHPLARYRQVGVRGMSPVRDWHDWLGGLPFEVATPERVFDFMTARGFELTRLRTCGGRLGCNEFVFRRRHAPATDPGPR